MKSKLVIIRGNSGSGKTTISKLLRDRLGPKTMLLQQDVIRRDILKVEDKVGNPAVGLIEQMIMYGLSSGYTVIVEGILSDEKYGAMLRRAAACFDTVYTYYFDIPFEETLARHHTKLDKHEFGEKDMRDWWKEKDYLRLPNERMINEKMSIDDIVREIVADITASCLVH